MTWIDIKMYECSYEMIIPLLWLMEWNGMEWNGMEWCCFGKAMKKFGWMDVGWLLILVRLVLGFFFG